MLYREAGQFKTSYASDQAIFPILQDRLGLFALIAFMYVAVPLFAGSYHYEVILLPLLVYSLAALGLNVLTGYCGQISLGTGGFMAVGAYSAFKLATSFPDLNIIIVFLLCGLFSAAAGILFGIPSLRIKGFYLAVATLAAQFFFEWLFQKYEWFHNYSTSATISAPHREFMGFIISGPRTSYEVKYYIALTFLIVFALIVKNLARSHIGRSWMAIRDMDIAAEIIGIRPMRTKLTAFAVSCYIVGVAGALFAFLVQGNVEADAFDILTMSFPILFMIIIGGLGSVMGSIAGAAFMLLIPVAIKVYPGVAVAIGILGAAFGLFYYLKDKGVIRWLPVILAPPLVIWFGYFQHYKSHHAEHLVLTFFGLSIILVLIFEPQGLTRLWQIAKEKLRLWPFPH